jgi:hypothetical protein
MSIRIRHHIKRPPDDNDGGSSPEAKAKEIAQGLSNKSPRIFLYCAIGMVILILIALAILIISGTGH